MKSLGFSRRTLGIVGMLTIAAIALLWAAAPAAAGPTPQDYNPGEIYNDTYSDFASALNVTANQSEKMEFYLDCPGGASPGEFDFMYVWVPAGMDLSIHMEVDPSVSGTVSFRGYLVSPEYFRLAVNRVPLNNMNDTYFNTTTRIAGQYFFAADGQASCLGGALLYNMTWVSSPTGAPDDGDNSILDATPVTNGTLVSSSLTETTDQADFITTDVTVSGSETVLLRLSAASGIILTNGFQFEIYNATSILTQPPSFHQGLSPNSSGIGLIQNGLQVRENATFIIRMWSNGLSGAYSFRVLIETYTPKDTNLDFASARALSEIPSLDGGLLNYTYEKVHYHKIFVGGPANARTFHVQVWSDEINIGIRLFNEQAGTLTHLPRDSSRHNPSSSQTPADIETIDYYASAANLTGETGWYYIEVTIEDDLPPDGSYAIAFYFNDGPVGTSNVGLTTDEDVPYTGYDVSSRFTDLDCTLDSGDPDCSLALALANSDSSNVSWNFTGAPLLTITPAANWSGRACANFSATDSFNLTAFAQICITVNPVNDAPELTGVAPTTEEVPEDGSITRLVSSWFSDVDGDNITITFSGNSNFTVTLQYTPPFVEAVISPEPDWNGCENITYTGTDVPGGLSVSWTVDTCVLPLNDAPEIRGSIPEVAVNEDAVATMDIGSQLIGGVTGPAFYDVDGDPLTYRVYDMVDVTVTVSGTILTITPDPNFAGLGSFSVAAYDGIVESTRAPVRVRVAPVNDAPTIDAKAPSVSPVVVSEGDNKTFTVTASDIDGDSLSYTWYVDGIGQTNSDKPSFTLEVPITEELARSVVVRVEVQDGVGGTDEASWTVNIENTNLAPAVTITSPAANAEFTTDDEITFSATGTDADGDTLTFSWTSDLVGAAIGNDQTFTAKLPSGTHRIRVMVSDGTDTNEANVTIVVKAPPDDSGGPGPDAAAAVGAMAVVAVAGVAAARLRKRK